MLEIVSINLDNELDLPITHKKAAAITKYIGLTLSTQTTFATAVSEACRAVLEKTLSSVLSFRLKREDGRWFLSARITTDGHFTENSEELKYAKRLIPVLEVSKNHGATIILLRLGIPRSVKVSGDMASRLAEHMRTTVAESPYEEVKQRNQELFSLAEQKEEQLKLAALLNEKKSEFLSIASHELRSPLTIIKAYAQMGKSFESKDPAKMAMYLDKINQQATKVNTLIQQLLDVSKIENNKLEYQMERVDLNTFIAEVLGDIRIANPSHVIEIKPMAGNGFVSIDKLRLEQALVNLIGNAIKYSAKGKLITVSVNLQLNDQVVISVKDEGIGLSEENLARVFEKFFRAEDISQKVSGLGMGLYITTHIIKGHRGNIWAESKENEGSTFSFSLPLVA
ncbi:HAMP domain-containing sensor histidine kinase [Mucilaginibacter sp. PAMB04274]|uniref:HAMP domain-containing sensor histidine kinase n=1 Tax=Mucilaginibacter sp. PAMB04274 TaxID=3138568 RepID=UPI0031F6E1DE